MNGFSTKTNSEILAPLFPIKVGEKWGFINHSGEVVIEPRFERVGSRFYSGGVIRGGLITFRENKKWGCADRTGKVVIEPRFDWEIRFSEGLAPISESRKHIGFIDENGDVIIKAHWYRTGGFSEGLASVEIGLLWGFAPRLATPRKRLLNHLLYIIEAVPSVIFPDRSAYIDHAGKFVLRLPAWWETWQFCEGLAMVGLPRRHQRCGYIDRTGSFIIQPRFHEAEDFSEGFAAVLDDKGWGYINKAGDFISDWRFHYLSDVIAGPPIEKFSEGLAAVLVDKDLKTGRRWEAHGYIDSTGELVIEPRFHWASPFSEGLAACSESRYSEEGKIGFINHSGEFVIPPIFDLYYGVNVFNSGLAYVLMGKEQNRKGETGYIDKNGHCVWGSDEFRHLLDTVKPKPKLVIALQSPRSEPAKGVAEEAQRSSEKLAYEPLYPINVDEKWGFINRSGQVVIEPRFDGAPKNYGGMVCLNRLLNVKIGEQWGYIDRTGQISIEPQFEYEREFNEGLACVQVKGGFVGYINETGEHVIRKRWAGSLDFHDGLARIYLDRWGGLTRISPRGNPDLKHRAIEMLGKIRRFSFLKDDVQAYIDHSGEVVFRLPLGWICDDFNEGLARARQPGVDGLWGYVDRTGNIAIEPRFRCARNFSEGLAAVAVDVADDHSKITWGYIDRTGEFIIEPKFEDDFSEWKYYSSCWESHWDAAPDFHEGVAGVSGLDPRSLPSKPYKSYGYINRNGEWIIEPSFSSASPFSDGRALVLHRMFPRAGYMDKSGQFAIPPKFDVYMYYCGQFLHGLACVSVNGYTFRSHGHRMDRKDSELGYIDTKGECVWGSEEFRKFLAMEWW